MMVTSSKEVVNDQQPALAAASVPVENLAVHAAAAVDDDEASRSVWGGSGLETCTSESKEREPVTSSQTGCRGSTFSSRPDYVDYYHRSKLCIYFLTRQGGCAAGEECPYAHCPEELKDRKSYACPEFEEYGRCDGLSDGSCPYGHGVDDIHFVPRRLMEGACKYGIRCRAGDNCRFAHTEEEMKSGMRRYCYNLDNTVDRKLKEMYPGQEPRVDKGDQRNPPKRFEMMKSGNTQQQQQQVQNKGVIKPSRGQQHRGGQRQRSASMAVLGDTNNSNNNSNRQLHHSARRGRRESWIDRTHGSSRLESPSPVTGHSPSSPSPPPLNATTASSSIAGSQMIYGGLLANPNMTHQHPHQQNGVLMMTPGSYSGTNNPLGGMGSINTNNTGLHSSTSSMPQLQQQQQQHQVAAPMLLNYHQQQAESVHQYPGYYYSQLPPPHQPERQHHHHHMQGGLLNPPTAEEAIAIHRAMATAAAIRGHQMAAVAAAAAAAAAGGGYWNPTTGMNGTSTNPSSASPSYYEESHNVPLITSKPVTLTGAGGIALQQQHPAGSGHYGGGGGAESYCTRSSSGRTIGPNETPFATATGFSPRSEGFVQIQQQQQPTPSQQNQYDAYTAMAAVQHPYNNTTTSYPIGSIYHHHTLCDGMGSSSGGQQLQQQQHHQSQYLRQPESVGGGQANFGNTHPGILYED